MSIDNVSNMYVTPAAAGASSTPSSSLDKDGFLKMLTAQIQNQDPSSSQDPNQYFQTISAMTMVEQVTNLARQSAITGAESLVGRTVSYAGTDNATVTGVVKSVDLSSGDPRLTVDGMPGIDPAKLKTVQ
jgi:flagellar basal-body rod modification protein FlgD